MYRSRLLPLLVCVGLAAAAGCQPNQGTAAPAEAPAIPVSRPVEREVSNYEDFTGQTDAVQVVDIRARVTGYLNETPFKEGSEVHKGDLLFVIDPRPYQAQLDQAEAQVVANEASFNYAKSVNRAISPPPRRQPGADEQDYAAMEQADARMKAAVASTEVYKLNMEFTGSSPITGQISRYYVTPGNLVNQDSTLLTTIVSLDPMYAYFEMDEPTLLRIRRAIQDGRMKLPAEGAMKVLMGLQGEDGYPHEGVINFFNNQVNSATGSISLRGVFPNPRPPGDVPRVTAAPSACSACPAPSVGVVRGRCGARVGRPAWRTRLLSPGMFVRIRLPIGEPHKALLVIDGAILSDQGQKYVYVVGDDKSNTCPSRPGHSAGRPARGPQRAEGRRLGRRRGAAAGSPENPGPARSDRHADARRLGRRLIDPPPTPGEGRVGPPSPRRGRRLMISRFFIDRPVFATVLSVVITLIGGIALIFLPIAVPAHHAAGRRRVHLLSRRLRPGRGRHRGRADRAGGQRRQVRARSAAPRPWARSRA